MAKFLVKLQRFFVDEDPNNPAKAYTFYTRVERSVAYNQLLKMVKEDRVKETRRQSEDEVRRTLLLTPHGMEAKQREEARMNRIQRHELTSHKEKEDEQIDAMMEFYD